MKYSEAPNKNKKAVNTGLYVIIALCLLIIGGAAWFAISANDSDEKNSSSDLSSENRVYSEPDTSYNDNGNQSIMEPPMISSDVSTPTADSVSSEPYSSKSETDDSKPLVFTMPVQGEIIKKHSENELQFSKTYGDMRIHTGVDIAAKIGTHVSACCDGVVESIAPNTTLGTIVTIDHKNGIIIKYASLDNLKIQVGSQVKSGDIIGTVGTVPAECMDGEHLHLEVLKNGKNADPLKTLGLE